jgi:hypothetical protein
MPRPSRTHRRYAYAYTQGQAHGRWQGIALGMWLAIVLYSVGHLLGPWLLSHEGQPNVRMVTRTEATEAFRMPLVIRPTCEDCVEL